MKRNRKILVFLIKFKQKIMLQKIFTVKHMIFGGIIIGLIIMLMQVDSCRNRDFQAQQNKIDSLTLANQKLVQDTNRLGQVISKQMVITTADQENLKTLTASLFNLMKADEKRIKQVNALIQIASRTGVTERIIPFVDLDRQKKFSDSVERACADVIAFYRKNTVELTDTTKTGELAKHISIDSTQDKFFQIDADVLKDRFKINKINFPDSQRIAIIVTKGGLFKRGVDGKIKIIRRKSLEIQVIHTNPNIEVTGMSSVIYQPGSKGRWLERAAIFAAGAIGTYLLLK